MSNCMQMKINGLLGSLVLVLFWGPLLSSEAQSVPNYAVRVSANVQTDPPEITLSWPVAAGTTGYTIYRKGKEDIAWGNPTVLPGTAANYTDRNLARGAAYEYHVWRTSTNYDSHAYIFAGIEAPLIEFRGKVILLVDRSQASGLAPELARLQQDLVGDGWSVLRHDVPRMTVHPADPNPVLWAARSNEVAAVKALIKTDYLSDRAGVKAVFILGHVPVPYSGGFAPDQHADHVGAWPADIYYGDMDGVWTDISVSDTGAADRRNHNVPGDGKFDQSVTPAEVTLEVGRVDMADLPAFPLSEQELLRQYLNKDHSFRQRLFTVHARALIDDTFGVLNQEVPALSGWSTFEPLVGPNISTDRWLSALSREDYLWGYGCGSGTFTKAVGVAETIHFIVYDTRVVFTMLFGSYFGDWDSQNNLLRAQLGTASYTLTSAWSGRPNWYLHHMALGETIGFSTRVSQKNAGLYADFLKMKGGIGFPTETYSRGVHIALLGDPTLRLQPMSPPGVVRAVTNSAGAVELSWAAADEPIAGYHVYRGPAAEGPYSRLTPVPTGTGFADLSTTSERFYMVRAVKLETSGGGTYFNASQGSFAVAPAPANSGDQKTWAGGAIGTWNFNDVEGEMGASPGWDGQTVEGTLNVGATAANQFTVRITSGTADGVAAPPAHFDKDDSYTWPIVIASDQITGFDAAKVKLLTSEFRGDLGGGQFTLALSEDGKSVNLVFIPNHAPRTETALFNRAWDTVLQVDLRDLMARFTSDSDGDPRSLVQVGSSTNGTAVSANSTSLFFAATNNFPETISYWVQDIRDYRVGDTVRVVEGLIRIEPLPAATQFVAHHAIELEWHGELGHPYQLQYRLETGSEWVNQGEPILGTGAKTSLFERIAVPAKFYRIISLK